ncbi:polysaccharide biosynthesis tyrosine autokinase [Microbacterium hydrocarbonoxydans]|uniref:polysaccharide biosynthesis tyrosine autokinase n=1 Tax=Microbacterium hydrocarbonoxydans TaxID=273678 RepID=UPI0013D99E9B|nr:polysaccharide biosynthesis tyrosine autokinase [Microbacterium hydrocarbonoxydans]
MDLIDLVRVLRRNLTVIIAGLLVGISCGALVAMLTPQRFDASTDLMISVSAGEAATPVELAQGTSYAQQVVETYRTIITSSAVLQPVIDDLGLSTTPAALADRVTASAGLRSTIITITVRHPNPGQAARIANAIGDSFSTLVTESLENGTADATHRIRVISLQSAQVPLIPSAPNVSMSLVLGAVLGLAAGIGIALLRTVLDTRIHALGDLETTISAPVLGGIAFDPKSMTRPLVVASDPQDPIAEAYRTLRTNVRFLFPRGEPGVFVVTSSGPGEGKTTTASNLAIAFAETGQRVALVDADMRLPRVAERFGIEGGIGLSDVLAGRVAVGDVIQRWGRGALFVLPAGTIPPNPAELLGSPAMSHLVDELTSVFDVVIIDSPPTLLVTDAAVVSRFATGTILVAAAGTTTKPRLADAVTRIEAADSRVLGSVVTMLPTTGADRTAYGTYAYGAQRAKV